MTHGDLMLLLLFSTVQPCLKRLTYQSSAQRFQGQSLGHTKIQFAFQQGIPNSLELGLKLTEDWALHQLVTRLTTPWKAGSLDRV